jgi:Spy/CpxP family protein refolding chaperone
MKTRKGLLLSTVGLLLATAVMLAAGEGSEKWTKMKQELGLSDAQVAQLQQKFAALSPQGEEAERKVKELHRQLEEMERAGNPDQKAVTAKKQELEALTHDWNERTNQIYRSVLTKEQFTKFEQMHEKGGHEGKEREEKEKKQQ